VVEQHPVNLFGYWTLLRARPQPAGALEESVAVAERPELVVPVEV